jgi:outer membrane murein-binding lipoprotein Lpp
MRLSSYETSSGIIRSRWVCSNKGACHQEAQEGKGLAARVGRLEREVKEMARTVPIPAEQQANARAADVAETLSRFQGSSRDDLTSDAERGGVSPLGHGTGERRKRR